MKRFRIASVAILSAAALLAGCESNPSTKAATPQAAKPAPATPAATPAAAAPAPAEAAKEITPEQAMEQVREAKTTTDLQRILTDLGYKPGSIDGVKGKKTVDALKQFQQDHKLPATGVLDPETVRMLESAKP